MTRFWLFLFAAVLLAQNPNTPKYPGALPTDTDLHVAKNLLGASLTLAAGIDSSTLTLNVNNGALAPVPGVIRIEYELIKICSRASNVLTVCSGGRGYDGSVAAAHNSGTLVNNVVVAAHHNQLAAEIKAITTALGTGFSSANIVQTGSPCADGKVPLRSGGVWTCGDSAVGSVPGSRTINTTSPLGGGGDLTDNRTLTCSTCVVTTGSYSAPSWLTGLQPTSAKDAANGYAGLTAGTKLNKAQGDEVWGLADLWDATGGRGNGTLIQMTAGSVATDDCAKFDAAGNIVSAGAACGTGLANTSHAFTAQTSVTLTHSRNSTNVIVSCYGPGDVAIGYNSLTVTDANNVAVTFTSPQTGRCVVNSSGGGGGGGGGVSQVNGTANEIDVANPTTTPTLSIAPNVDFSTKTSTKTMKTGTAPPGTCSVGELFFDTDATAGSNIYACTATNTWTLQAGGNSVANTDHTFTAQTSVVLNHALNTTRILVQCYDATTNGNAIGFNSLTVTDANNVTVTFASAQTGRCVVNGGSGGVGGGGATDLISLSDVTAKQGNGTVVPMYAGSAPATNDCAKFDAAGNLTTAGAPCGAGGGGTPGGTNGQIQYNNAGAFGGLGLGSGLSTSGGNIVLSSAVASQLSATAVLDFANIAASTCLESTFTLTGALVNDTVQPGWPSTIESGLLGVMFVSAADTVKVRLCKITTGSVDPASQNFTATIVRSF